MYAGLILSVLLWCGTGVVPNGKGAVSGVVVNGATGRPVGKGVQVLLRIKFDGQYAVAAETATDEHGRFRFAPLPLRDDMLFIPGANQQGVHFTGPTVRLSPEHPEQTVVVKVFPVVSSPCPLVLRRWKMLIQPQPGLLRVSERLEIENPTKTCYVGEERLKNLDAPVTLRLHIPPTFQRVTFEKEFFGRHFTLDADTLVTTLPWPPGRRVVAFSYVLPNQKSRCVLERPLDLPCESAWVQIENNSKPVQCNLPERKNVAADTSSAVVFVASAPLPKDFVLRVELGRLPVPWPFYARWVAVAVLLLLVLLTLLPAARSSQAPASEQASPNVTSKQSVRSGRSAQTSRSTHAASQAVSVQPAHLDQPTLVSSQGHGPSKQ